MSKLTLLVVDDVEMNRKVIKRLLSSDFTVLEADNGKSAIDVLEHNHVDVMVLDIIMPEMDGLETINIIKQRKEWNTVGILVATSKKEQTERSALASGADDVVSKPYDPCVIKQRVKNILAKKELDRIEKDDIKGISAAERREVDKYLRSIKENSSLINENKGNEELIMHLNSNIQSDIDFLLKFLTEREGF